MAGIFWIGLIFFTLWTGIGAIIFAPILVVYWSAIMCHDLIIILARLTRRILTKILVWRHPPLQFQSGYVAAFRAPDDCVTKEVHVKMTGRVSKVASMWVEEK